MTININAIKKASEELLGNIVRTPTIRSQYLSNEINSDVFLKLENLQYTSSFKVRGAYISIKRLKEEQKKETHEDQTQEQKRISRTRALFVAS